jgi:hypothetical protein
MSLKSVYKTIVASSTAFVATAVYAHPGHEPEDWPHALAHELMSPRGILVLLLLAGVVGLRIYLRRKDNE